MFRCYRSISPLALLLLGLATPSLSAQVDIEALRLSDPPLGRSGTLGGDVSIRTGNVDFIAVDLSARMYDVTPSETRLLIGDGGVGFIDRSRFASSGLLHYRRLYTTVSPRFNPEWYGQLNYDRAQRLTFRALAGSGLRTGFARGDWGEFGAGSGFILEYERLALPDTATHPANTLEVRWTNFLTLRILATENLVVTSTTYVQPALTTFGDYRALEKFRVSAAVSETMALTVSFDLRYDSRPPSVISALDTRLRTGITYSY